jgi:hypothetical protein
MNAELIRRLHRIVDARIDARDRDRPRLERLRGVVTAVSPQLRVVSARLDGSRREHPFIPYGALPVQPVVGDEVVVERTRDGWAFLSDVLGRDPIRFPHPSDWGVTGLGVKDDTDALVRMFEDGGEGILIIPEGSYLVAHAGANAGGVSAYLDRSLRVIASSRARFFTDGLDNDMIGLSCGPGIATGDWIQVDWWGGHFDMRRQKGSTSKPFDAYYPAVDQGESATCDGLSFHGTYTRSGTPYVGMFARVTAAVFHAGTHWETGGGDSAIYMQARGEIVGCDFTGCRDLAVYGSGDGTGLAYPITVRSSHFVNCFHGAGVKRGVRGFQILDNDFTNCVRAITIDPVTEHLMQGIVRGNTGRRCNVAVHLNYCEDSVVVENLFEDAGATTQDGTPEELAVAMAGVKLQACTRVDVIRNRNMGVDAASAAAWSSDRPMLVAGAMNPGSGSVASTDCRFERNRGSGWKSVGPADDATNVWIDNTDPTATTASVATGATFERAGTLPTAAAAYRGKTVIVAGGAGVADAVWVCIKNAADAFEWVQAA